MIDIRHKQEYTGDEFSRIMTEPEGPGSLASEYLNADLQACSANIQNQLREARAGNKPFTRPMIPGFYGTQGWTMSQDYKPGGEPTYTISGPVLLGPAILSWGLSIHKCNFTEQVRITDLITTMGITFRECTFDKGIIIDGLTGPHLSFDSIKGPLDFSINDSTIKQLRFTNMSVL